MYSTVGHSAQHLDPSACLTPREAEILTLVATGLCAKEIALRLAISPKTVDRHIEHIKMKIHARNRAHLVSLAYSLGYLEKMRVEQT